MYFLSWIGIKLYSIMKTHLLILLAGLIYIYGCSHTEYKTISITDDIELIQITDHAFIHTSYSEIPGVGRVSANGLVFENEGKAFLFDTPVTDPATRDLVTWIQDSLGFEFVGFVPNHWHDDCTGGLTYLHGQGIESYANQMTIDILKTKGLPLPKQGFTDSLELSLGNKVIKCYYLGAGHSVDNISVWIPSEKILYGGCMVKNLSAPSPGDTTDAIVSEWPVTIDKMINKFSMAEIVIPGHGRGGDFELLTHTKALFSNNK